MSSEAIRTGRVVHVGDAIDGSSRNAANPAFFGLVQCDGSELEVIIKLEPAHRLAKELIAVSLAARVGIEHAPGLIGYLDQGQINRLGEDQPVQINGCFPCFASETSRGSPLASDYEDFLHSSYALDLLVFDQFIANFDRTYGNILQHEGAYAAFDHDKILFVDEAAWAELPVDRIVPDLIGMNTASRQAGNVGRATAVAGDFSRRAASMSMDFLRTLAEFELFGDSDAVALEQFFKGRAAILPSIVQKFFEQNS